MIDKIRTLRRDLLAAANAAQEDPSEERVARLQRLTAIHQFFAARYANFGAVVLFVLSLASGFVLFSPASSARVSIGLNATALTLAPEGPGYLDEIRAIPAYVLRVVGMSPGDDLCTATTATSSGDANPGVQWVQPKPADPLSLQLEPTETGQSITLAASRTSAGEAQLSLHLPADALSESYSASVSATNSARTQNLRGEPLECSAPALRLDRVNEAVDILLRGSCEECVVYHGEVDTVVFSQRVSRTLSDGPTIVSESSLLSGTLRFPGSRAASVPLFRWDELEIGIDRAFMSVEGVNGSLTVSLRGDVSCIKVNGVSLMPRVFDVWVEQSAAIAYFTLLLTVLAAAHSSIQMIKGAQR